MARPIPTRAIGIPPTGCGPSLGEALVKMTESIEEDRRSMTPAGFVRSFVVLDLEKGSLGVADSKEAAASAIFLHSFNVSAIQGFSVRGLSERKGLPAEVVKHPDPFELSMRYILDGASLPPTASPSTSTPVSPQHSSDIDGFTPSTSKLMYIRLRFSCKQELSDWVLAMMKAVSLHVKRALNRLEPDVPEQTTEDGGESKEIVRKEAPSPRDLSQSLISSSMPHKGGVFLNREPLKALGPMHDALGVIQDEASSEEESASSSDSDSSDLHVGGRGGRAAAAHAKRAASEDDDDDGAFGSLEPVARSALSRSQIGTPSQRPTPPVPEPTVPMVPVSRTTSVESTGSTGWRPRFLRNGSSNYQGVAPPPEDDDAPATSAEFVWYGVWSAQGVRPKMEDAHTALTGIKVKDSDESFSYFAVFDGHCGRYAAELASQKLHKHLVDHEDVVARPSRALQYAFSRVEQELLDGSPDADARFRSGCTAVTVIIRQRFLIVANLGDSRAVLCRAGGVAEQIGADHTPASEAERVAAAGGWVTTCREIPVVQLGAQTHIHPIVRKRAAESRMVDSSYICGEIGVSRALGDPSFKLKGKSSDSCWTDGSPRVFAEDLVSAEPDILHVEILDTDSFVILACDGLWEVLNPQEAVELAAERLQKGYSPAETSKFLIDVAMQLGSGDNITVLLVVLHETPAGSGMHKRFIRRGAA